MTVPAGAMLFNADSFPSYLVDADGTVLDRPAIGLGGGQAAITRVDEYSMFTTSTLKIYDVDLVETASGPGSGYSGCHGSDRYLYVSKSASGPSVDIQKRNPADGSTLLTRNVVIGTNNNMSVAVTPDDALAFLLPPGTAIATVYQLDLATGAVTTFATAPSGYEAPFGRGNIACDRNGYPVVAWQQGVSPASHPGGIRLVRYRPGGATDTIEVGGASPHHYFVSIACPPDSDTVWCVIGRDTPNNDVIVRRFDWTGSVQKSWTKIPDNFGGDFDWDNSRFIVYRGQTPALEPVPSPTPPGPQIQCDPMVPVSGGGTGGAGCNVGGVGRDPIIFPAYGAVPVHPDPAPGELLAGKAAVDLWIEWHHINYPAGTTTTIVRSLTELADDPSYHGGRKPAALIDIGDFEWGLGNETGSFEAADCTFHFSDAFDRWIRNQLGTQELEGDEVEFYLASPAARKAMLTPRILMRGIIQRPETTAPLQAILTAVDVLFSIFGPLGRYPKWPFWTIGDVFPNAPADVASLTLPVLYGPKTDKGAKNPLTGASAEKGLVPWHYVGTITLPGAPAASSNLPTSEDAGIGEVGSDVFLDDAVLGGDGDGWTSNGIDVDGDPFHRIGRVIGGVMGPLRGTKASTPAPVNTVYGFRQVWNDDRNPTVPDYFIAFQVPAEFPDWDPFTNPAPAGANIRFQIIKPPPSNPFFDWQYITFWPNQNAGTLWTGSPGAGGSTSVDWDMYLILHGASYQGSTIFASDLGGGDPTMKHDRVAIDIDSHNGSEFLYPWANDGSIATAWASVFGSQTYIDQVGVGGRPYRITAAFARGPRSDDHKNGVVNITSNFPAGIEDVGDGTGKPIVALHDVEQHLIENFWLDQYRHGNWCTNTDAPKWPDGTYKVRSTRFAGRQAFTKLKLGGIGLEVGWYVDTAKPIPAHVVDFNQASETDLGLNNHGQISLGYFDETLDPTTFPALDHRTSVFGKVGVKFGLNRENIGTFSCDWDPDAKKYRIGPISLRNDAAVTKFKGVEKPGQPIQSPLLYIQAHLEWVGKRRLIRLGNGLISVTLPGNLGLMDIDIDSDGFLLTSIEGRSTTGYVQQPMQIRRVKFSLTNKRIVTYTCLDIGDVLLATRVPGGLTRRFLITNDTGLAPKITNDTAVAPLVLL